MQIYDFKHKMLAFKDFGAHKFLQMSFFIKCFLPIEQRIWLSLLSKLCDFYFFETTYYHP